MHLWVGCELILISTLLQSRPRPLQQVLDGARHLDWCLQHNERSVAAFASSSRVFSWITQPNIPLCDLVTANKRRESSPKAGILDYPSTRNLSRNSRTQGFIRNLDWYVAETSCRRFDPRPHRLQKSARGRCHCLELSQTVEFFMPSPCASHFDCKSKPP